MISASILIGHYTSNMSKTPAQRNVTSACHDHITWSLWSPYILHAPHIDPILSLRACSPTQSPIPAPPSPPITTTATIHPLALLVVMATQPNHHTNLIRDTIISLAQYGLHFQNIDRPVINSSLHLLVHKILHHTLMGQSTTHICIDSTIPFTITKNRDEYNLYAHNQDLYQWLVQIPPRHTVDRYDNQLLPSPPLLFEVEEFQFTIERATSSYQEDIIQFLTFTERHTTMVQHPSIRPSHLLNASLAD